MGWIFMIFDIGDFMKICLENPKFGKNSTKTSGTLYEGLSTVFFCDKIAIKVLGK
jgi:hypothetical protein